MANLCYYIGCCWRKSGKCLHPKSPDTTISADIIDCPDIKSGKRKRRQKEQFKQKSQPLKVEIYKFKCGNIWVVRATEIVNGEFKLFEHRYFNLMQMGLHIKWLYRRGIDWMHQLYESNGYKSQHTVDYTRYKFKKEIDGKEAIHWFDE